MGPFNTEKYIDVILTNTFIMLTITIIITQVIMRIGIIARIKRTVAIGIQLGKVGLLWLG